MPTKIKYRIEIDEIDADNGHAKSENPEVLLRRSQTQWLNCDCLGVSESEEFRDCRMKKLTHAIGFLLSFFCFLCPQPELSSSHISIRSASGIFSLSKKLSNTNKLLSSSGICASDSFFIVPASSGSCWFFLLQNNPDMPKGPKQHIANIYSRLLKQKPMTA